MKQGALFATFVGITNTICISLLQQIDDDSWRQTLTSITTVASPFLALLCMRFFIKLDHPPELIRREAAVNSAISVCKSQLKNTKGLSPKFIESTQATLEDLLLEKQKLHLEFAKENTYKSSLTDRSEENSDSGA